MTHSHPNPWMYAGQISQFVWDVDPKMMPYWHGQWERLNTGDLVTILKTPSWLWLVSVDIRAPDSGYTA